MRCDPGKEKLPLLMSIYFTKVNKAKEKNKTKQIMKKIPCI